MKIFTNNFLKIVALITMIIDHFGFYFSYMLNDDLYSILRIIGRISMPIFAFLIVEGFGHTKNVRKYITRIAIFALITQFILALLDKAMYRYNIETYYDISSKLNILFSFMLSLISLYFIKKIINTLFVKKGDGKVSEEGIDTLKNALNAVIYISFVVFVTILFYIFKFDYGIKAYLLIIGIYLINILCEYLNRKICLDYNIKNGDKEKKLDKASIVNRTIGGYIKYSLYICLFLLIFNSVKNYDIFANLALFVVFLYNGRMGKKNIVLKYGFYILFLFQHILLYVLCGVVYKFMYFVR